MGSINEHNFIFQEFWAVLMNPVDFQKPGFWKKLMTESDWPGSDLKVDVPVLPNKVVRRFSLFTDCLRGVVTFFVEVGA